MNFKAPYVFAMREHAPKMFVELCTSDRPDQHLQEKSVEAHALLEQLLAPEPKGVDGLPKDPQALQLAEERVLAQMLESPPPDRLENIEPHDEPEAPASKVPTPHLRLVKYSRLAPSWSS